MSNGQLSPKTPQQWLRLAIIPLLVLVLILVLSWPAGQGSAVSEPAAIALEVPVKLPVKPAQGPPSKWPAAVLEEVIAFNPFEPYQFPPPPPAVAPETAAIDSGDQGSMPEKLPPRSALGTLQAVYVDAHGAAAILDSKVVRVGDVLPSGDRVAEITAQGIRLEGLSQ